MRRFRLTTAAKVLILVLILALAGGGVFAGLKTGFVKFPEKHETSKIETNKVKDTNTESEKTNGEVTVNDVNEDGNVINTEKENNSTINISLDEWIG